MTDALIEQLFDLLIAGSEGPLLNSRMALSPEPERASYFIAAPRPVMTCADMSRIEDNGLFKEVAAAFVDIRESQRTRVLDLMEAIVFELAKEQQSDDQAEPSTLVYALH